MSKYEEFLAGERYDDIAVFLHEDAATDLGALAEHGTPVEDGIVLVVDGEQGRSVFQSVAGIDPMGLAGEARETESHVDADLTGGECPSAANDGEDADHFARFVFAFSEAQNDDVDGIYTEGDVMHAYVSCACGQTYSDRWVIGDHE